MGLFDSVFGGGGDAAEEAYEEAAKFSELARKKLKSAFNKQYNLYEKGVDRYSPFANISGLEALPTLLAMTGVGAPPALEDAFKQYGISSQSGYDITQDPGYQFRLQQGEESAMRAAAAGGKRFSGETLVELSRYGQDMASQEYNNIYNRLTGLSNMLYGIGGGARDSLTALDDVMAQRYGSYGSQTAQTYLNQGISSANAQLIKESANQSGLSGLFSMAGSALSGNYSGALSNLANIFT